MNLIIDASIAVKWFIPEENWEFAARLQGATDLYAPDFMLLECTNILVKKVRRREITYEQAEIIRQSLLEAPLDLYPWQDLLDEATLIAHETYRSVYDCIYLSLAKNLSGKMVTADKKFYLALENHSVWAKHILWVEHVKRP